MSLQSHYERDDAHSAQVVAAKWRVIWMELQIMGCCVEAKATNNYNTYIENISIKLVMLQLYQMYVAASLDIQIAFNDVPDEYDSDPGDGGAEVAQRTLALCVATKSWVDSMCNAAQSFLIGAIDDVLPIAVGAVAIPIIPIPISLFIGLGVALYSATAYTELGREDYRDYLHCAMYEALRGQVTTTQVAFDAAFDNLPARPPPSETGAQDQVRDLIEAWFRAVVNDLENYLAFVSVMGSAMSVAATLDPVDCGCIAWEVTWLGGFNEAGDWDLVPFNPGYADTTYNATDDRFEGTCVDTATYGARCEIAFTESTITRIRAENSWSCKRSTSANKSEIGHDGDIDFYASMSHPCDEGNHTIDTGVISVTEDNIRIRSAAGSDDCAQGGYARINKIIINGEGLNPFL
jgi:hypothetical protein